MFIIKDWANNILFNSKEFDTFEDGWEFLYLTFPEEEDFGDYYVCEEDIPF
jgi:hypothetical protein